MARTANRLFLIVLASSLAALLGVGQSAAQTSPSSSPSGLTSPASSVKGHGVMPVGLTKSLDSTKLKEGDAVTGSVMADLRMKDGTTIPRGSKVTGHVTEAKARSKGNASSALGIVFDKISLPAGKDLTIKGEIQAVAPNPNSSTPDSGSGSIGPGMMAGHEGAGTGTTAGPAPSLPTSQQAGHPLLNAQSKGVLGIKNLELGENSVLTSEGKDVKLDSGAQMMVRVEFE